MFDWFWEFLYMISCTIFRLIDGLIGCANMLCGIEKITFNGEENDLLSYLFFSEEIGFAFRISAILATILLVIFTVFMIVRSVAKEKAEGTPAQIAVKAFKTILMFFLVPGVMLAFMTIGNAFVKALYDATMQAPSTPGSFLFGAFAADGGMLPQYAELFASGELDYVDTSKVSTYMNLSDFPFFFSWIAGGVVLFGIGSAMLIFVDRILSLVILYIAAPISISTCTLDDGARFKLWRDQFLSKFIMGYGMILAINIYALVCGLVMDPSFAFFPEEDKEFLNFLMKLLIIGGGALTMQKAMALVGNLVSQGAGSNELRDNAFSMGSLARMAKGAAGKALTAAGYLSLAKAGKSIVGDAITMQSRHLGGKLLRGLGMDGGLPRKDKKGNQDSDGSGSKNDGSPEYGDKDKTKDAIAGNGFNLSFDTPNTNNQQGKKKDDPVSTAINGGGQNGKGNTGTNTQTGNTEGNK